MKTGSIVKDVYVLRPGQTALNEIKVYPAYIIDQGDASSSTRSSSFVGCALIAT